MNKKISLNTIAKQLNCSSVSVYKALNNQEGVGEDLKNQIISLSNELGYKAPPKKINNLTEKNNYVYVVDKSFVLNQDERFYTSIFFFLNQLAAKSNSTIQLIIHDNKIQTMTAINNLVSSNSLSGIFIGGQIGTDLLNEVSKIHIHTVCIDFFSSDYLFDYVYIDNYYSGYLLTKYLIKNGHKDITYIGNIKETTAIADRYFGFRRALNKYNVTFNEKNHINVTSLKDSDIDIKKLPTAFICRCDNTANELYQILKKHNIAIPTDVSVVSFDNTDLCSKLTPNLTSLGLDKIEYAKSAFSLMQNTPEKNKTTSFKLNLNMNERLSTLTIK